MALPEHLAEFERRVAARLADAVEEMRRSLQAKAERASSQLLTDLESYRPALPSDLFEGVEIGGLARPSRDEARGELARELKGAIAELDATTTQDAALEALLRNAGASAHRAALWLTREDELLGWASIGFGTNGGADPLAGTHLSYQSAPALERVARGRGVVRLSAADAARLANELEVAAPKSAAFVPLVLRDRVAAALYVDRHDGELELELVQLLTHAAAQRLELQSLTSRSYTPTLVLEEEAPAGAAGLSLWRSDEFESEIADGMDELAGAPAVAEQPPAGATFEALEREFELESAPDSADAAAISASAPLSEPEFELENDTLSEPMPSVDLGLPALDAAPSERFVLSEPAAAEISWAMEEAESVSFAPAGEEPAVSADSEDRVEDETRTTGRIPIFEAPTTAPFQREISAESAMVESTAEFMPPAPESQEIRTGSIATHEFALPESPATAPAPDISDDATILLPRAEPASTPATTFQFETPPAAGDTATPPAFEIPRETVAIPIRPAPAEVPPVAAWTAPPAPPAPAPPPTPSAAPPSPAPQADDEPTLARARTTEVVPPPDVQGPGWAFTSNRTQRASGENALHEEARRLARLLISEIKLYNEEQVEEGRRNRDVYHRLKDDIDRSRQIYEERVHDSVRATTDYFQQELVRSLAGGDPRALGI